MIAMLGRILMLMHDRKYLCLLAFLGLENNMFVKGAADETERLAVVDP